MYLTPFPSLYHTVEWCAHFLMASPCRPVLSVTQHNTQRWKVSPYVCNGRLHCCCLVVPFPLPFPSWLLFFFSLLFGGDDRLKNILFPLCTDLIEAKVPKIKRPSGLLLIQTLLGWKRWLTGRLQWFGPDKVTWPLRSTGLQPPSLWIKIRDSGLLGSWCRPRWIS